MFIYVYRITSLEVEFLGQDMSICNFGSYRHITFHREEEYIFVSIHQSSIHVSVNENIGFLMVSYGKGVHGQVLGFLILIKWQIKFVYTYGCIIGKIYVYLWMYLFWEVRVSYGFHTFLKSFVTHNRVKKYYLVVSYLQLEYIICLLQKVFEHVSSY